MNQTERIKQHLETFGEITSFQAFREYGCTRLSARIFELRNSYGMQIEGDRKTRKNRFDEASHYMVYRLSKTEQK